MACCLNGWLPRTHYPGLFPLQPGTDLLQGFAMAGARSGTRLDPYTSSRVLLFSNFTPIPPRTVCCRCTEATGRPAYVGEEGTRYPTPASDFASSPTPPPRAHLVSAHDTLGELLLQETGDLLAQQVSTSVTNSKAKLMP